MKTEDQKTVMSHHIGSLKIQGQVPTMEINPADAEDIAMAVLMKRAAERHPQTLKDSLIHINELIHSQKK